MLELPGELRQLEQIDRERKEWAVDLYPVTEKGLLARFNPHTHSPPQTSPVAEEQSKSQAQIVTFPSTSKESPCLPQVDLFHQKPPLSSLKSTDVSPAQAVDSPDSQASASGSVLNVRKQIPVSNPSIGAGRGQIEVRMDTVGQGWPFGNEQSTLSPLPAIGRGFLLHMPPAQIAEKTPGVMETTPSYQSLTLSQEMMVHPSVSLNSPKNLQA